MKKNIFDVAFRTLHNHVELEMDGETEEDACEIFSNLYIDKETDFEVIDTALRLGKLYKEYFDEVHSKTTSISVSKLFDLAKKIEDLENVDLSIERVS